jgi:hypothetical protein
MSLSKDEPTDAAPWFDRLTMRVLHNALTLSLSKGELVEG